jgi:hypothetical protein
MELFLKEYFLLYAPTYSGIASSVFVQVEFFKSREILNSLPVFDSITFNNLNHRRKFYKIWDLNPKG